MKKILFALLALIGIAACEPVEPAVEHTLSLIVDKSEIIANGEDVVTFAVKRFDTREYVENATIHFADTHEALEGMTFKTKYAGEYSFYAKCGSETSEVWTVVAKEPSNNDDPNDDPDNPVKKAYVLSVSPATIVADGVEKAVFTLKADGEVVADFELYNAADDTQLAANEFSTTVAGKYSFYAMCEGEKSNTVEVTATEVVVEQPKPITLTASKSVIKANGVDIAQLTVTEEGGADVTSAATIFVNGGALNGNKFATTAPGTYTLYATKGEMKSNEVTITAEEVTDTGKTIVFADGVTISSGWYDVNKKGAGDNGDINMCWAAAASNMIQWFQDRYVAQGGSLPAGAIDGPGTKYYGNFAPYELALMEVYHDQWDNSHGGNVEYAIPWYFEGKLYGGEYASNTATPSTSGGYWKSVWSGVEPYIYRGYKSSLFPSQYPQMYTYCYENYWLWGPGSSLKGQERLAYVSNLIVEAFERGMASLTVSLSADIMSLHHAVTLWGYEIDNATGLLTRVWITDSDDFDKEPKTQLLNEYTVSIGEGNSHPQFKGTTRYGSIYLVSIHPFSGYQKN
ncbi:MAG: IdeS/Mac family cysteine endopeptidase [Alistipes sp.]|nr:IdeS/Mac family cysteine endopeptidase [Alistipes sp.]